MKKSKNMEPKISSERFNTIRKIVKEVKNSLPVDILSKKLDFGQNKEDAFEKFPEGKNIEKNVEEAEIRRLVSHKMYDLDSDLPDSEKEKIIERQITKYFDFQIDNKDVRGHIEVPHGTKPSKKIIDWCKQNKVTSFESKTTDIAKNVSNHVIFKKSRLFTDINSLPFEVESSIKSEDTVFTKEDNLNAVKAQRDLTKKILESQDNLDKNNKAERPHLVIYFHGKSEIGDDLVIGARQQKDGKGPLDPRIAIWFSEKLKELLEKKEIKNKDNQTPTINTVFKFGAYAGSPALTRMRFGDEVFDFTGFGEMLQCLQLECSLHLRKFYSEKISEILEELLQQFSITFQKKEDLEIFNNKIPIYLEKIKQEENEMMDVKNIVYDDTISSDEAQLNNALIDEFQLKLGDEILINNKKFFVIKMNKNFSRTNKNIALNGGYKDFIKDKIDIKKYE